MPHTYIINSQNERFAPQCRNWSTLNSPLIPPTWVGPKQLVGCCCNINHLCRKLTGYYVRVCIHKEIQRDECPHCKHCYFWSDDDCSRATYSGTDWWVMNTLFHIMSVVRVIYKNYSVFNHNWVSVNYSRIRDHDYQLTLACDRVQIYKKWPTKRSPK